MAQCGLGGTARRAHPGGFRDQTLPRALFNARGAKSRPPLSPAEIRPGGYHTQRPFRGHRGGRSTERVRASRVRQRVVQHRQPAEPGRSRPAAADAA